MLRLVLYAGCTAAIALAVWLMAKTLEPGTAPYAEAQRVVALPDAPPSPGIEPDVAARPAQAPPSAGLPQAPRSLTPRDREPAEATHASAPSREVLSDDDPVRQLLDATWQSEIAEPTRSARPGASRRETPERETETGSRTAPPVRAPAVGIIALAPPIEPAPSSAVVGPDDIATPEITISLPQQTPTPMLSPSEIADRVDPALPEPVQDVVYDSIQVKAQQAADWTNQ